jgi:hypothetical protein
MPSADVTRAYKGTLRHRTMFTASKLCGCFYCHAIFPPADVVDWLEEGNGTALCPKCTVDSIIGDASGFPIKVEFLARMKARWFNV